MIFSDFVKALGQIGDPRFRGVLGKGVGLTVVLLFVLYAIISTAVGWFAPETLTLPLIGEVSWVDELLSGASILLMLVLSVFLMVPVASAFTSMFLDEVADAVEDQHYPGLPKAQPVGIVDGLRDSLNFLGILIAANIGALVLYLMFAPLAPFIFWGLNGFLLGREYFQLVAMRRIGRVAAKKAFRENIFQIWLAGSLMAIPLTFPLINLSIPVMGAATFTHLYHRVISQ
jgi:uncharacterized protein involved in cysteine biosynthesis